MSGKKEEGFSVNAEAIRTDLDRLNKAIETFKPYSKKFLNEASDSLDGMNSNFTSSIDKVLKNMTDTKAPKLVEKLDSYASGLCAIIDAYLDVDNKMAESLPGKGSKR